MNHPREERRLSWSGPETLTSRHWTILVNNWNRKYFHHTELLTTIYQVREEWIHISCFFTNKWRISLTQLLKRYVNFLSLMINNWNLLQSASSVDYLEEIMTISCLTEDHHCFIDTRYGDIRTTLSCQPNIAAQNCKYYESNRR